MENQSAKKMWEEYAGVGNTDHYDVWQFGAVPDKLADLTLKGIKRATSSAFAVYVAENEPIPQVGTHSVILNSKDEAVCIIKDVDVKIVTFNEISEADAAIEGEGDKSLAYWREVHIEFFTDEMKTIGKEFSEDMLVIFEEYEVVYPRKGV